MITIRHSKWLFAGNRGRGHSYRVRVVGNKKDGYRVAVQSDGRVVAEMVSAGYPVYDRWVPKQAALSAGTAMLEAALESGWDPDGGGRWVSEDKQRALA